MLKTILLFLSILICTSLFSQTVYVSTDGNDNNDGTINSPYKTFSKAMSAMSAGSVCIIKGGTYEEALVVDKSGTDGNYLTFKAADGETVTINATTKVNGWQLHSGSIYKTTVNMTIDSRFRAVYHNKEYMDLARWPNNTDNNRWTLNSVPVTGGDGSHFLVSGVPTFDWTGGYVYYLGAHSGTSWTRAIEKSTGSSINYTSVDITKWPFTPHNPTVYRNYPGNNYGQLYLFNKLEALDYAREWYYDSASKTLYFQPSDNKIPQDNSVEIAINKFAAQLNGQYIKVEGIHFFGGSINIKGKNNIFLNNEVIHGSEGHDDLNNTGASVGESAIEILGANSLVKGCTINHSSVNGITVQNWSGAHNTIIEENYISNIDYLGIHATPIRSGANNVKVLKNTIINSGRDGLYVSGNDCEVAYNDVSIAEKINADSGIFYTVGNTSLKNTKIHHNWFHDSSGPDYSHATGEFAKAAGIYLDNNSKGYVVHHNVIWNVSWSGYQVNWNNTNLDFYHNTIWNAERAMDSWVNGYTQENNKIYNNFANTGSWFTETATDFDIKDNLITTQSPFEDASTQNFVPKAGSSVLDKGRIITGFTKPYKGSAPDIGAYERGGTKWTAGVNAIEDTGEGTVWTVLDTQFKISTTSETCPNKKNGKLTIIANIGDSYIADFNGKKINFTKETTISDLAPGTYAICISIDGSSLSQCFNFEIIAASQISGKSSLINNKLSLNIEEGTAPYSILINNKLAYETSDTTFSVDVKQGDIVQVKSTIECEGTLTENIHLTDRIVAFPNPTSGSFQLLLPITEGSIQIALYNLQSQLISSKEYTISSGKVTLDLENNPAGIYIAKITTKQISTTVKIIKK